MQIEILLILDVDPVDTPHMKALIIVTYHQLARAAIVSQMIYSLFHVLDFLIAIIYG